MWRTGEEVSGLTNYLVHSTETIKHICYLKHIGKLSLVF